MSCSKELVLESRRKIPGMKLAITIRHLASGDKYPSLLYNFRVAKNTITLLIPQVCQFLIEEYKDDVIKCPTTPYEWCRIAEEFKNR